MSTSGAGREADVGEESRDREEFVDGRDERAERDSEEVVGDLDETVAGALCYVLGFVSGLVFYFLEDDNEFVRFHATQSVFVFGGLFVLGWAIGLLRFVFEFVPYVGWIFSSLLGLVSVLIGPVAFVLWIALIYKAYNGERYALPFVGEKAERYV